MWHLKYTKAVDKEHFQQQQQDSNSTINTKGTDNTGKRSTSKKGRTFTIVKKDNGEVEDENEDPLLPSYEESLRENGVISLSVGGVDPVFGGDCISEFVIGCVQVDDAATPATTKGVAFADAGE